MKKLIHIMALLVASFPAMGQLRYGANLDYYFDNREFDISDEKYLESETLHSVRLTPAIAYDIVSDASRHSLTLGLDIFRDMGSHRELSDSFQELTLYYDYSHEYAGGGNFALVAGVFPRRKTEGEYGEMIWSEALRYYDPNLEGMLVKYGNSKFYTELGCDWSGKYSYDIRERFQIFSYGGWTPSQWLKLGWSGLFYHYATSEIAKNVIDNHTLCAFVNVDLSRWTGFFDEWSLRATGIAGYQRSREIDPKPVIPAGGEFSMLMRKWNLSLLNTVYAGGNMQHYFDRPRPEGGIYGFDLYASSPYYRGFYGRSEISWQPKITDFVSMRISARFHYDGSGFLGSQQLVTLLVTVGEH